MVKRKTRLKIFLAYALCILMAVAINTCISYSQQMRMESYGYISDYEAMRFGTGSGLWTILLYGGLGLWLPSAIAKELKKDDEAERELEKASKDAQTKEESALDCEVTIDTTESEMEPGVVSPEQEIKTDDTEQENDSLIEPCESGLVAGTKDIPCLHELAPDDQKDGKYAFEQSEYVFRPREAPKKRDVIVSGAWAAFAIAPIVFCAIFVLVLLLKGGEANIPQSGDPQIQQEQSEATAQEFSSSEDADLEAEIESLKKEYGIESSEGTIREPDEIEALEQAIGENRKEHYLAEYAQRINFEPEWAADAMQRKQTEYEELCARYIEALEQAIEENRREYELAELAIKIDYEPEKAAVTMQQAQTEYEELNEKYQEALAEYEEIGNDIGYNAEEGVTMPPNAEEPNADAEHGEILVRPAYECVCPFAVKTLSGGNSYYIRLRYIEPEYSAEIRDSRIRSSQGNEDDIAVFCTGGDLEINVPPGKYELWYCTGSTWKGTDTYFGNDTTWYMSEELLEFSEDEEYVYGNTVTLYPVAYGNFDTTEVASYEIPEDF